MRVPLTTAETDEALAWVQRIGETVCRLAGDGHDPASSAAIPPHLVLALDVLADDLDAILHGRAPDSRRGTVEEDAQRLAALIWACLRVHLGPGQSLRPLYAAVRVMHDRALAAGAPAPGVR
ncbi:hypothetical protein [Azospirillum sp.]|uniref:hypothetical protein n=1 Tax=Azospirillum sp. TaxID=34012 RepID=UPI002D25AA86|nr:hypothetical protein [Azospirillum sp.]HYD64154.1 hypothetical protein [Azospirillum sp.]